MSLQRLQRYEDDSVRSLKTIYTEHKMQPITPDNKTKCRDKLEEHLRMPEMAWQSRDGIAALNPKERHIQTLVLERRGCHQ